MNKVLITCQRCGKTEEREGYGNKSLFCLACYDIGSGRLRDQTNSILSPTRPAYKRMMCEYNKGEGNPTPVDGGQCRPVYSRNHRRADR